MSNNSQFFNQHSLSQNKLGSIKLSPANRGFKYGDGFFETMRMHRGNILFQEEHETRMQHTCRVLGLNENELPSLIEISSFLAKHSKEEAIRLRITFFRKEGVGYTPSSPSLDWVGEWAPLDKIGFTFGVSGLHTAVYEDGRKMAYGSVSNVKSLNAQVYVAAGRFAQQKNLKEVLVLNQHHRVCEGVQSNLFIVSDGELQTPALSEGPVAGVMRSVVLGLAQKIDVPLSETQITVEDVLKADEVFFTNTIRGIQWCVGFRNKRYKTKIAKQLHQELCALV